MWKMTEVIVYIQCHEPCICVMCFLATMIYHKFYLRDILYKFNGENINVMLEYKIPDSALLMRRLTFLLF